MLNCPELAKRQVLSSLKQGYDGLKRNLLGGPVCAEWQGGSSEGSLPARRPYNGQDYDRYALSRFATKNLAPIACGIGLDELQRVGRGTPAVSDEMCARALLALLGVLELTVSPTSRTRSLLEEKEHEQAPLPTRRMKEMTLALPAGWQRRRAARHQRSRHPSAARDPSAD